MLARLVAFDTTSRDGNIPADRICRGSISTAGDIPHFRVDYEAGKKTNLFATIGPDIAGGIVLSGHTDVVPVDGQTWASDPFELDERDGKALWPRHLRHEGLHRRGTGHGAGVQAATLKTPIHLALSCDEEVGCKGVRPLVAHMRDHLPKPRAVIVGEPTSMQVVNAHKGAHLHDRSDGPRGAFEPARIRASMPSWWRANSWARSTVSAQDLIARGDPSDRFNPPYSTVHVGVIEGGTAKNIIPRHCSFQWETRLLPAIDPRRCRSDLRSAARALEPGMKRTRPIRASTTGRANIVPGLAPEDDSPAEHLALHLAGANGLDAVSYCTEAGLFQQIGIPAIICGPGSIEQAHKPDEYVEVSQLKKCESFMRRLADYCAG